MRLKEVANKGVYGLGQKCGGFTKEQAIPSTPGISSLTEDMSLSGPELQVYLRVHSGGPGSRQRGHEQRPVCPLHPQVWTSNYRDAVLLT